MKRLSTTEFLLVVLSLGCGCHAAMSDQEVHSEFRRANDVFRQANNTQEAEAARQLYEQAILGYERILNQAGVHSAALCYNLANAYFLKGDLGRAILHYRRAKALDPSNYDIDKNLTFARGRRIDQMQVRVRQRVAERLFFWHYDFSMRTRFTAACAAFAVLCTALTVRLWLARAPGMIALAIVLGLATACLAGSVALDHYVQSHFRSGVIVAESVVARQGDGPAYAEAFKEPLHAGAEFDLVEQRTGWWHIELPDGNRAWIPQAAAELI